MTQYNIIAENEEYTVVSEYETQYGAPDQYQSEAALEKDFIKTLAEQGYEYLPIHTEKDLVDNLRVQLQKLNHYTFTDAEWERFFGENIANKNDGIEETDFHTPGWGWPASLVDVEGGYYYMFSAKYRTKKEFYQPDNVYTVTKFALPDPKAGDVTLTPRDILSQFDLPFDIFITQGGTLKDGRIYYMFGFGTEEYPDAMRVIDLGAEAYLLSEDLSQAPFSDEEVECCAFYRGRLLVNTQAGKLYERF